MGKVTRGGIQITNLNAFRADLKRATGMNPVALTAALKTTGPPVVAKTKDFASASHLTGELEGGYKVSVARNRATLVSTVPYAGGAEWGQRGKWSGFLQYGGPGRFAWKAVEEDQTLIAEMVLAELRAIIEVFGWADER